jgi:hypothetical protein
MKDEAVTDALLRQFLLGQVDDEERQRIESLFLTNPLIRERILVAEQDLIEEYLDDSLPTADRKGFLSQYAETSLQQRRLRIAQTIKDWAGAEPGAISSPSAPAQVPTNLRPRFNLKPVVMIPIAIAAAIAVIFAVVWINGRIQRNREYLALQQEIARLNANRGEASSPFALTLAPVSLRSADQSELTKRVGVQREELRLISLQKEVYPSYRAVLRRVGDDQSITIPDLHAQPEKVIPIKLPSRVLTRGAYQIELSGIAADGSVRSTEEYGFTVRE